jgi:sulfonate transport system permease protein
MSFNHKKQNFVNIDKKKNDGKSKLSVILRGITFPVFVLVIWELATRAGMANPYFLPSPSSIFDTFIQMLSSGLLGEHLWASIKRLTYGFLITVVFAIPLGIIVGKAKYFRHWVNPTLSFLQQIPPIAWIPIFILWLGIEEASKVAVIVYASFFPVFLNTVQGVNSVDPNFVEVGRAYMLTPLEMVRRVYIPSAAMSIFVGLRLGLSNCWRALVGAELIAASSGIGSLITDGRALSQPNKIFVAVFTIGVAGSLIDLFLKRTENRLMPWKKMYNNGGQR